jgi:hypothetical protein
MTRWSFRWTLFGAFGLAMLVAAPAFAQATGPELPAPAWAAELARLDAAVERLAAADPAAAAALQREIPRRWRVSDAGRTYTVDAEWLTRGLAAWQAQPDEDLLEDLRVRLRGYRDAAIARTSATTSGDAARTRLEAILADREFHAVHGPGWFDRLLQRISAWLIDVLEMTVGTAMIPTVTRWLVIALVVMAVALVLLALRRALRRTTQIETIAAATPHRDRRQWPQWLDAARAAADRGDWREAIRFAYWCGVSYLEAHGAWRPDPSRTPREYLRLLPAADDRRPPLAALTTLLERVWYGSTASDRDRYDEALALLERLGCRSR